MNQDFDELVRDSMRRFTDGVDLPAGLAGQARAHVRRQRRARVGWAATGTSVAAAAAMFVATAGAGSAPLPVAGGTHHAKSGPKTVAVETTAVVISKVDRALAKVAAGQPVGYTQQTMRGVKLYTVLPHGKPFEVNGALTRSWSRGPHQRFEVVSAAGKILLSTETDVRSGKSVVTTISYQQRAWWRGTFQPFDSPKPKVACTLGAIDRTQAQWTREVKKLLSCGAKVAGHEQVDGADTVKLKLSSAYKRACAASSGQGKCIPQSVGWTGVLWANASTFLPVRLVSHGHHYSFQIDFRWLAPSPSNLAMLHQPVPAGFRHA